jgi:RNA polymerase sigma factor (sigma-70 family)
MDQRTEAERAMLDSRSGLISMLRQMLPMAQAEEVVQEAFLRLHASTLELQGEDIRRYLYKMARNIAISRLRHEKVIRDSGARLELHYRHQSHFGGESLNGEQLLINESDKKLLLEAINAMPPICRQVFILRKINEKPQSQIAEEMGISVNTVQNHLTNGMKFCRHFIHDRLQPDRSKKAGQCL